MNRIAVVGCGLRIVAFAKALTETYNEHHTIVGLMDTDPGKMAGFAKRTKLENVPQFTDFDTMCAEVRPDMVIIGTIDTFHADYIIRALDKKIGVISEKPLCTTQEQCLAIREACRRNPEVFAVTSHNSRYRPVARTLKKVLDSGVIGEVQSVEYRELLDRIHGKSYFRRWNSRRKFSNGLQLHKSSHHFDKLNFLLDSHAVEVCATGSLVAYGADVPHEFEGTRCCECPHKDECPDFFAYDESLYDRNAYTPDMCIWSKEIDIEDNFSATIKFANGVLAAYTLCAYADYEGEVINIQGTKGRVEARQLSYSSSADDLHNMKSTMEESIRIFRFGQPVEEVPIIRGFGSHGGADAHIFSELFAVPPAATLPGIEDGIQAVLTGAAIVKSMQSRQPESVQI